MRTIERISAIDSGTPRLAVSFPLWPAQEVLLLRLLKAVNQGLSGYLDQIFRPLGFTESSFHTLALIFASEHNSASPSMLCELVGQTRANMTRILDSLTAKGYISRTTDANDGRRMLVRITAEGKRLIQGIAPDLGAPMKMATGGLNAQEMGVLEKLLRKLAVSMDHSERRLRAGS